MKKISKREANYIKEYIKTMVKYAVEGDEELSDKLLDKALHYRRLCEKFLSYTELTLIRDLSYAKAHQYSNQLTYANIFKILETIFGIKVE